VNAAERLGIPAVTFWRLREGKGGASIQHRTADRFADYRPSRHVTPEALERWRQTFKAAVAYAPWALDEYRRWVARRGDRTQAAAILLSQLRHTYPRTFRPLDRLHQATPPERLAQAGLDIAEPLLHLVPQARVVMHSDLAARRLTLARVSVPPALRAYLDAAVAWQCQLLDLEQGQRKGWQNLA
jgi:hypothetical protein